MVHLSISASSISSHWHGKAIHDGTSLFFLCQMSSCGISFSRVTLLHFSISASHHVGMTTSLVIQPLFASSRVKHWAVSQAAVVHLAVSASRHVITRAWQDHVRYGPLGVFLCWAVVQSFQEHFVRLSVIHLASQCFRVSSHWHDGTGHDMAPLYFILCQVSPKLWGFTEPCRAALPDPGFPTDSTQPVLACGFHVSISSSTTIFLP